MRKAVAIAWIALTATGIGVLAVPEAGAEPVEGATCNPDVDHHGFTSDHTPVACANAGRPYATWVLSVPVIGPANHGERCNPSVQGFFTDLASGRDLICVVDIDEQTHGHLEYY
ncbi:hypothetical protein [Nocardia sp. NPDC004722]